MGAGFPEGIPDAPARFATLVWFRNFLCSSSVPSIDPRFREASTFRSEDSSWASSLGAVSVAKGRHSSGHKQSDSKRSGNHRTALLLGHQGVTLTLLYVVTT